MSGDAWKNGEIDSTGIPLCFHPSLLLFLYDHASDFNLLFPTMSMTSLVLSKGNFLCLLGSMNSVIIINSVRGGAALSELKTSGYVKM